MRNPGNLWLVLLGIVVVFGASAAWAGAGDQEQAESEKTQKAEKADEDAPLVYDNEYLRKRFGGEEEEEEPAPAAPAPTTAKPAAGEAKPGDAKTADEPAAKEEKKKMSAAERTKRMAEIRAELERLNRRTLALTNPLLAGTVPATDEEREKEQGMDNRARLDQHKKRIADLEKELADLQKGN